MIDLILATNNLHKVREIRAFLKPLSSRLEIFSLSSFNNHTPPEETGATFEENASLKALHAAKTLKKWALADDSGLVVPALGGQPGIHSARYGGPGATDRDNRRKLLKAMESLEGMHRAAYFDCVIALASPEGKVRCVQGRCEGMIAREERGRNGFGYDPIFIKHDYNLTFGEIVEEVKNRISHRAKAFSKLLLVLEGALT